MKIKGTIKAGSLTNHNQKLVVKSGVRAGVRVRAQASLNHNQKLVVKSGLRAGSDVRIGAKSTLP